MNKNHYLALLAFVLLFFSCSKEDDIYLPLLKEHEINVEPTYCIRYVKVYYKEITISIDSSTKSWCNAEFYVSPQIGWSIAITISENDTEKKRSGKITINTGAQSKEIIINQEYFRTGEFQMQVIPDEENQVSFYLNTFGVMIDWDDNSEIEVYKNYEYYQSGVNIHYIGHQYADREPRDIKVICRLLPSECTFRLNDNSRGAYKEISFGKIDVPMYILCNKKKLEKIDVTKLALLKGLDCDVNELTSIDLSHNRYLNGLRLSHNKLESLDLSANIELIGVSCSNNQLSELNVNGCIELEVLYCNHNRLENLNFTDNEKMIWIECSNNQLSELNINGCVELTDLLCNHNRLKNLDFKNNKKMDWIECKNNLLSASGLSLLFESLLCTEGLNKHIHIENNPGTAYCNKKIATQKGWKVYSEPD